LDWRQTVRAQGLPREVFVQPNTFETDGCIHLKEYDNSVEGVIRSWAERMDELNRCAELATQNRQS
jgi:dipeptidyl-peptidase-3